MLMDLLYNLLPVFGMIGFAWAFIRVVRIMAGAHRYNDENPNG